MDESQLARIADELYALDPAEFTAARAAKAKTADAEVRARVADLPKPSAAAWMTNLLAREHARELDEALSLGASLRDAQEEGDRARLVELGAERRARVAALVAKSGELAEAREHKAGAALLEQVSQTLQVGILDPAAAAAVRSGRLTRALQPGDVATDAVALPEALVALPTPAAATRPKGDAARLRREAAEAEALATAADSQQREIERRLTRASDALEKADAAVDRLEKQLRDARHERDRAADAVADMKREREQGSEAARTARGAAVRARRRADSA